MSIALVRIVILGFPTPLNMLNDRYRLWQCLFSNYRDQAPVT